jgi:RHS repeat-associated protein
MPVAMTIGGFKYCLSYDQIGSLRIVANASGNVVKNIDYDSFGNVINDNNPDLYVPFGFAGGMYDRDTGLLRFGYRDYDPDTGRWLAVDPIGIMSGDLNLYRYVWNNPVILIDPWGLRVIGLGGQAQAGLLVGGYVQVMALADINTCKVWEWDFAFSLSGVFKFGIWGGASVSPSLQLFKKEVTFCDIKGIGQEAPIIDTPIIGGNVMFNAEGEPLGVEISGPGLGAAVGLSVAITGTSILNP